MNGNRLPVFSVLDVEKRFTLRKGRNGPVELRALDGVRLDIEEGSSVALVGESGSGKSTLVRLLLGLDRPGDGRVLYDGSDLQQVLARDRPRFAREVAFVYQDARGSMNPRFTIGDIVGEPIRVHRLYPAQDIPRRVSELLERVGLPPSVAVRYPHQLSGGQVRRVAVARAGAAAAGDHGRRSRRRARCIGAGIAVEPAARTRGRTSGHAGFRHA